MMSLINWNQQMSLLYDFLSYWWEMQIPLLLIGFLRTAIKLMRFVNVHFTIHWGKPQDNKRLLVQLQNCKNQLIIKNKINRE